MMMTAVYWAKFRVINESEMVSRTMTEWDGFINSSPRVITRNTLVVSVVPGRK